MFIFAGTCGNILSGLKVKPSKLLTWQQLLILEKSMHAHSVYVTGGKIWLTSSPRQVWDIGNKGLLRYFIAMRTS
jgi:hypothetical protein